MKLARTAILALVAAGALGALTIGAAFPAQADPISNALNLFSYMLDAPSGVLASPTLTGSSGNTPEALAAWQSNFKRIAAESAGKNRAFQTTGVMPAETGGDVVEMSDYPAGSLGAKLGTRIPATGWTNWAKPTGLGVTPGGVAVATVAMLAWDHRADIGSTVTSWTGANAQADVCGNSATSSGFLNWVTGQDCSMLAKSGDYVADTGMPSGWTTGPVCDPSTGFCVTATGESVNGQPYGWGSYCFTHTGTDVGEGVLIYINGAYRGKSSIITYANQQNQYISANECAPAHEFGYYGNGWPGTTMPVLSGIGLYSDTLGVIGGIAGTPTTQLDAHPLVVVHCVVTATDGSTLTGDTESFHEGDKMPQANCPTTPLPKVTANVTEMMVGPGINVELSNVNTTPAYKTLVGARPECVTHSCLSDLIDLTSGHSCFSEAQTCDGWISDPSYSTKYKCTYGGQDAPRSDCFAYANTFNTAKRMAGDAYADPATGEDPGVGTSPSLGQLEMASPVQDPGAARDCQGGSDPNASWVAAQLLKPIQCALAWAFVPRAAVVQGNMQIMSSGFELTGPGKLAAAVSGWKITPVVAGCSSNLAFPVPLIHQTITIPVIQACPGTPMGDFAPWVRGMVSAGLAITAGFAVKRIISGWLA